MLLSSHGGAFSPPLAVARLVSITEIKYFAIEFPRLASRMAYFKAKQLVRKLVESKGAAHFARKKYGTANATRNHVVDHEHEKQDIDTP